MKQTHAIASGLALALGFAASPVLAGGLDQAIIEPAPAPVMTAPPVVAPSGDWTGFYAGAQLGYGTLEADPDVFAGEDVNGALAGIHLGYLYDLGNFVVGGEIDNDWTDISSDAPAIDVDMITRLKVRAGYDAGNLMPYLTAGGARVSYSGALDGESDGGFFGGGVEYKVTDSIRVGGEVLQHRFTDFDDIADQDLDATTVAARVSFQF